MTPGIMKVNLLKIVVHFRRKEKSEIVYLSKRRIKVNVSWMSFLTNAVLCVQLMAIQSAQIPDYCLVASRAMFIVVTLLYDKS